MRDICLSFVCLLDIRVSGLLLLYVFFSVICFGVIFKQCCVACFWVCASFNLVLFSPLLTKRIGIEWSIFFIFFSEAHVLGSSVLQIYSNFSGKNKNRKQRVSCSCSKSFNQKIGKACLILQFCSLARRTFFHALELFSLNERLCFSFHYHSFA